MTGFNKLHLIRQVDLFTLKLFLSAVDERQIGRAAAREHIAASAATKRIQDLEEIAGLPLLERTPKGVIPTPAGEVLVRYIRGIFESLEQMRTEVAGFLEGVRGRVVVASMRALIVTYLAHEIAEFSRNFPLVEIGIDEQPNPDVVRAVLAGDADMGVFVGSPGVALDELDTVPYLHDRLVALVPRGNPMGEMQSLEFAQLLDDDFIGLTPSAPLMSTFHAAARRAGRELKPRYAVHSVEVASSLVQVGLGVTVMPAGMISPDAFERLVAVPLVDSWTKVDVLLGTAKSRMPSAACRAFMQHLLERPHSAADQ